RLLRRSEHRGPRRTTGRMGMNGRIVKLLGCAWLGLSLGVVAATGCGQVAEDDAVGGETHWLRQCAESSECGTLDCLCGVCTAACTDDSACGALGSGARCVARGAASFPGECRDEAPLRLCAEAAPSLGAGGTGGGGTGGSDTGGSDTGE